MRSVRQVRREAKVHKFPVRKWNWFCETAAIDVLGVAFRAATVATVHTPAVQLRMQEIGADLVAPERRSADYLREFVESEIEKWAAPIRASGVSIN